MKITVVGIDYEGAINLVGLSYYNGEVFALDLKKKRVEQLRKMELDYGEPDFLAYLKQTSNNLRATSEIRDATIGAGVLIFADESLGKNNLEDFYDYLDKIAPYVENDVTLLIRFTLPLGESIKIKAKFADLIDHKYNVSVVYSPNFIVKGEAMENMLTPSRIVAGISDIKAKETCRLLFARFKTTIIFTSLGSAEITKYASDSFLAIKLSYFNSIANLCPLFNADAEEVRMAVALDKRIGRKYTGIGIGFGGSEIADHATSFYEQVKEKNDSELVMVKEAVLVNKKQPHILLEMAKNVLKTFKSQKIAIFGLTFKPNYSQISGSLAQIIIKELALEGARVYCYDPKCSEENIKFAHSSNVKFVDSITDALANADACIILNADEEFKNLTAETYINYMKEANIFDGRNIYTRRSMDGTNYYSIGRRPVESYQKRKKVI